MQDEDAFFRDYAESHKKLSELGFKPPRAAALAYKSSGGNMKGLLTRTATMVAVAAAVVAWAYLHGPNKKLD